MEAGSPVEPAPAAPGPDSAFGRLVGVFVSPVRTFAAIAGKPTWLVPLLLWTALSFLVGELVMTRMDWNKVVRDRLEQKGQKVTDAQVDQAVEQSKKVAWLFEIFPVLVPLVLSLIVAGVYWMACHAFGWELRFRQSYGVTIHAFLPSVVLSVAVLAMLWNRQTIDPDAIGELLPTNPGVLISAKSAKALHGLLSSLDLVSFWTMGLLVLGLSSATGTPRGRMALLVLSVWGLYVLGKTGLTVIFA